MPDKDISSDNRKISKPKWKHAVFVWWSIIWRTYLWGLIGGILFAIVVALVLRIFGLPQSAVGSTTGVVLIISFFFINIFAVKKVLSLKYKSFEIVFVEKQEYKKFFNKDDGGSESAVDI